MLHTRPWLTSRRRTLRKTMTPAEIALWQHLKGRQLDGRKFRRQHSCGEYILDFFCPSERLAIELDGAAHDHERAADRDAMRDAFLEGQGIRVLRFANAEVRRNVEGVLAMIRAAFRAEPASPPRARS